MNFSQSIFADLVYEELHTDDENFEADNSEVKKFKEKLKKQLSRKSTSPETLDSYLKVLMQHPKYTALNYDLISSQYVQHDCLNIDIESALIELSTELDNLLSQ